MTDKSKTTNLLRSLITPAKRKFVDTIVDIRDRPTDVNIAFMARHFVLCTLPHTDPGDIPVWSRKGASSTLTIVRAVLDPKTGLLVGFPYGSIPRLLMFWLTTEATRKKTSHLELGNSLSDFMSRLGLNSRNGTGPRGDAARLQDQARRLFSASISFSQYASVGDAEVSRVLNMSIASSAELWWSPANPNQRGLWSSSVNLGPQFYDTITKAPIPVDFRALGALKSSPLALDLYSLSTYFAWEANRADAPRYVPWADLVTRLGSSYNHPRDFRKAALRAMTKVQAVYPALKIDIVRGGITIFPCKTAVPSLA